MSTAKLKTYTYTCEVAYKKSGQITIPEGSNLRASIIARYANCDYADILRLEVKEVSSDSLLDILGFDYKAGDTVYALFSFKDRIIHITIQGVTEDGFLQCETVDGRNPVVLDTRYDKVFKTLKEAQEAYLNELFSSLHNKTGLELQDLIDRINDI